MTFILVILTVAAIIAFEFLRRARKGEIQSGQEIVSEYPSSYEVSNRYYHPGHTWAVVTNTQERVTVGADDFSERMIGSLDGLELPRVGEKLHQGEVLAALMHGNRILRQTSPISGTVVEINHRLASHPALFNESPLEKGWIAKIVPTNLRADLRNLLSGATADAWREALRAELIHLFSPKFGAVLQDGGEIVRNIGDQFTDEQWYHLIEKFYPNTTLQQSQNTPTKKGV